MMCRTRIDVTRDDAFDIYICDVIYILPYANQHASCRSHVGAVGSNDRWPTNELGQVDSNAQRVKVLPE